MLDAAWRSLCGWQRLPKMRRALRPTSRLYHAKHRFQCSPISLNAPRQKAEVCRGAAQTNRRNPCIIQMKNFWTSRLPGFLVLQYTSVLGKHLITYSDLDLCIGYSLRGRPRPIKFVDVRRGTHRARQQFFQRLPTTFLFNHICTASWYSPFGSPAVDGFLYHLFTAFSAAPLEASPCIPSLLPLLLSLERWT